MEVLSDVYYQTILIYFNGSYLTKQYALLHRKLYENNLSFFPFDLSCPEQISWKGLCLNPKEMMEAEVYSVKQDGAFCICS